MHDSMRNPGNRSNGPTQSDYNRVAAWKPRRSLALVIELVLRGVPFGLATTTGFFVARALPEPNRWGWVIWVSLVVGSAQAVSMLTDRLCRQMMPLPMLLRCSLTFPDQAPNRFSTALRSGSIRRMKARAAVAAADDDPAAKIGLGLSLQMVAALNRHDSGTRGHSERVRAYTVSRARDVRVRQRPTPMGRSLTRHWQVDCSSRDFEQSRQANARRMANLAGPSLRGPTNAGRA
jgi:hypothetical protein